MAAKIKIKNLFGAHYLWCPYLHHHKVRLVSAEPPFVCTSSRRWSVTCISTWKYRSTSSSTDSPTVYSAVGCVTPSWKPWCHADSFGRRTSRAWPVGAAPPQCLPWPPRTTPRQCTQPKWGLLQLWTWPNVVHRASAHLPIEHSLLSNCSMHGTVGHFQMRYLTLCRALAAAAA